MLFLNTSTTISFSRSENEKKLTKQQGVAKEEERTQAVLATQKVQRCANKLTKRGKVDRGRGEENTQKSVREKKM